MTIEAAKVKVGSSVTPSQNFTLRSPNDGTFRVSRGNPGAESGDVLSISPTGAITGDIIAGIGIGQTDQVLTGSRAYNTTYTNSTGRTIEVKITVVQGSGGALQLVVDGVVMGAVQLSAVSNYTMVTFSVKPGSTYAANVTAGAMTFQRWVELR